MARMPSHLSVASQRRVGNTVQVTLMADLRPFLEACRRFNKAMGQAMAKVGKALEDARRAHRGQFVLVPSPSAVGRLAWAQKREVYVAGLEGRYFVRGGLDSRYLEPEARDALVRELMAGRELPCLVSARERALVATAFLAGWVQGQGKDFPECLCWMTPPEMWTTYYGAVEPGSTMEWNPACSVHGNS